MTVAVVGKGGSDNTTTSAVLDRTLARRSRSLVAFDCDANATLGLSLGIGGDDPQIRVEDREGVAPIDLDPGSPAAATALRQLGDRLGGTVGAVT